MHGPFGSVRFSLIALTGGLTLLSHSATPAATLYKLQPILKLGDKVGDLETTTAGGGFDLGALNDGGQLVFLVQNKAGGQILVQYADGKLTPIVAGDLDGPRGKWPRGVVIDVNQAVSMNQHGDIAFRAGEITSTSYNADAI